MAVEHEFRHRVRKTSVGAALQFGHAVVEDGDVVGLLPIFAGRDGHEEVELGPRDDDELFAAGGDELRVNRRHGVHWL